VEIRLSAAPAHAILRLDGIELGQNPFLARLERDARLHRLVVAAKGYASVERALTFDDDQDVRVELEPRPELAKPASPEPLETASPKPAPQAPAPKPRARKKSPQPAPAPGTTSPKPDIFDTDPYGE
jgi:hypothetical protein